MKRLRKMAWNKRLRCVFAAAVLFYALFPQTGFCGCSDCGCSNKIPKSRADAESIESGPAESVDGCCCCKSKAKPTLSESCCSERSTDSGKSTDGDNCKCSCSETKLPPPPVQKTSDRPLQELENVKDVNSTPFTFPLIPESFSEFVFLAKTFETATSRLPVRLHLLLLVFLN